MKFFSMISNTYVLISVFINIVQFKAELKLFQSFKIYKSSVHPVNSESSKTSKLTETSSKLAH